MHRRTGVRAFDGLAGPASRGYVTHMAGDATAQLMTSGPADGARLQARPAPPPPCLGAPAPRHGAAVAVILPAGTLAAVAGWIAVAQGPHSIDDAYIAYQYARNLAEGAGLVFNTGERVEGYTNFGWVVALAAAHAVGAPLELAARLLAALCAAAGLAALVAGVRRQLSGAAAAIAGLALATDGTFARWAQDGMETAAFSAAVIAALVQRTDELDDEGRAPWSSLWFVAAAWLRPEGYLLFSLSWLFGLRRAGRWRARASLTAAGLFLAATVPHLVFRIAYYGDFVPNTFRAKVGSDAAQVERGLAYAADFWLVRRGPALAWAMGSIAWSVRYAWRRADTLLAVTIAAYTGYVVVVGGDWMGPGRFLVPMVAPLVLLTARRVSARGLAATGGRVAGAVAVLTIGICAPLTATVEATSVARERPLSESRTALGAFLASHAPAGATVLTNEIGQLGWYARLPIHDLHGLIDRNVARAEVEHMGAGRAGHERMDLDYSLGRAPTVIVIPGVTAAFMRGDRDPRFASYEIQDTGLDVPIRAYRFVLFRARPRPVAATAAPH